MMSMYLLLGDEPDIVDGEESEMIAVLINLLTGKDPGQFHDTTDSRITHDETLDMYFGINLKNLKLTRFQAFALLYLRWFLLNLVHNESFNPIEHKKTTNNMTKLEMICIEYHVGKEDPGPSQILLGPYGEKLKSGECYCSLFNSDYLFSTFMRRYNSQSIGQSDEMFDAEVGDEFYNKPRYTRSNSNEQIGKDGVESEDTLEKTKVDPPNRSKNSDDPDFVVNNNDMNEEEEEQEPISNLKNSKGTTIHPQAESEPKDQKEWVNNFYDRLSNVPIDSRFKSLLRNVNNRSIPQEIEMDFIVSKMIQYEGKNDDMKKNLTMNDVMLMDLNTVFNISGFFESSKSATYNLDKLPVSESEKIEYSKNIIRLWREDDLTDETEFVQVLKTVSQTDESSSNSRTTKRKQPQRTSPQTKKPRST